MHAPLQVFSKDYFLLRMTYKVWPLSPPVWTRSLNCLRRWCISDICSVMILQQGKISRLNSRITNSEDGKDIKFRSLWPQWIGRSCALAKALITGSIRGHSPKKFYFEEAVLTLTMSRLLKHMRLPRKIIGKWNVQGSACQDPMGNCPGGQGVLVQVIDLQEQPPQNTEVNHAKSQKVKEMWY